jgi:hypothetical protein
LPLFEAWSEFEPWPVQARLHVVARWGRLAAPRFGLSKPGYFQPPRSRAFACPADAIQAEQQLLGRTVTGFRPEADAAGGRSTFMQMALDSMGSASDRHLRLKPTKPGFIDQAS